MKTSLSSLDIAALVAEIRSNIVDSWVNNIYSLSKNLLILRFRKSTGTFEFVFELGKRFHLTKYERKKPSSPSNKVLSLRKHIRDLPVRDFYQRGLDRVVVFEIAYKDGFYKLVLELFGEGNLILVGPNNKIIQAYQFRRMKDRDIHPGKDFRFPPIPEEDISTLSKERILELLEKQKGKLSSVLNFMLNLGPQYSKEIIQKSDITTKTVENLSDSEREVLSENILELQTIIKENKFSFCKYLDEGEVVDITPIPLSRYEDLEKEEISSFNDSLDDFFSEQEEEPEYTEDKSETKGKKSKYEKTLKSQEEHLKTLIKQEEQEKKRADLLYTHFTLVDELLTTTMNARRNGVSWDKILEKMDKAKAQNIPSATILEKLEPKTKTITVKLADQDNNYEIINLDFTLTLVDNANAMYEKAKKARRKIPGAEEAIKRTKKLLEEVESKQEEIHMEVEAKPLVKKRTRKWYEKFHWFICEDKIVIGGKDVKTNERILKTYLDDTDLFFHADVHGAPYVVVKEGQEKLSDECLEKIAVFALSYSSLWKANKLIGDVYYVLPDQVSLTPPTGQYLAKGSVMIYGEKNYLKNIEINHAIGLVLYDEYAQIIGGPADSVRNKSSIYVELKPGRTQKGKIAKEIREIFLKKCKDEDKYKVEILTVNDILPFVPGDSDFIED